MKLLTTNKIRAAEVQTVRRGIDWSRLMENAGAAFSKTLRDHISVDGKKVAVVVGSGNNGGDGYVIARKLKESGASVLIIRAFGSPETPQSKEMASKALEYGIRTISFAEDPEYAEMMFSSVEIIIDAIFGIGFHSLLDRETELLINMINKSPAKVASVDIPSGLYADTGEYKGAAVCADITIALAAIKACHILPPASEMCGTVLSCSIGIPDDVMDVFADAPETIDKKDIKQFLPVRSKTCHKGTNGTALLVCGSYGMAGAAILAGRAATRSGAGLVRMVAPESIYPILANALPEAVHIPLSQNDSEICADALPEILQQAMNLASSICIGCGLGKGENISDLVENLLKSAAAPIILDADGINALAGRIDMIEHCKVPVIITPHPGEMARLLNTTTEQINSDRIGHASRVAQKLGITVVLKGANTIVATAKGRIFVNMNGNPGMATAGSGDALSGIIAALLAQGLEPEKAACCGVYLHAAAGDLACERYTELGMTVEDMISLIPAAFKEILR